MKRNLNLSVYKLLGFLLLGIAAYAFVNASNTDVIATAPVTEEQNGRQGVEETSTQRPPQSAPNRHTITLVLSQLSDLKVEEGQRINVGEIISDYAVAYDPRNRTSERTKLQAKKQRLVDGLTRAKLPLNAKTRSRTKV